MCAGSLDEDPNHQNRSDNIGVSRRETRCIGGADCTLAAPLPYSRLRASLPACECADRRGLDMVFGVKQCTAQSSIAVVLLRT